MTSFKVRALLFDAWWRENVVHEAGAATPFAALYRHYLNAGGGNGMGRQAFVARMNGLGVAERVQKGVRYRLGVRLQAAGDTPAPVMRMVPYVPGEGEATTMLPLDILAQEDEASARIAGAFHAARCRQRREKPGDLAAGSTRDDLVRVGALLIAAIETLDRKDARGRPLADEAVKATGV